MKQSSKEKSQLENQNLKESDYYLNEDGYIVFTENYHLKRGYCCGNGCKHCPYNTSPVDLNKQN